MTGTTVFLELELDVDYDYIPRREAIMPSPSCETGEPPEAEEFNINSVEIIYKEVLPISIIDALTDDELDNIEQQIRNGWTTEIDGAY